VAEATPSRCPTSTKASPISREAQFERQKQEQRQQGVAQAISLAQSTGNKKLGLGALDSLTGGFYHEADRTLVEEAAKMGAEQLEQAQAGQNVASFGPAAAANIGQRFQALQDDKAAGRVPSPEAQRAFGESFAQASRDFGPRAGAVINTGMGLQGDIAFGRQEAESTRRANEASDTRMVNTRDSVSARSERGNIYMPDGRVILATNRQQIESLAKQGGVLMGAGGGIAGGKEFLEPGVTADFQRDVTSLSSVRDNLGQLQESYKPEYLKYFTRGKAEVLKHYELLGGGQKPEAQEFLAAYDQFERLRGQDTMDAVYFYLRSTFTDKAVSRVEQLRLSGNITPAQFEKRLGDLQEVTNREIARRMYLMRHGFYEEGAELDEEQKKALDAHVSIGKVGGEFIGDRSAPTIEDVIARRSGELRQEAKRQGLAPGEDRERWVQQRLAEEFGLAQ
jgi:hypothetical protein